MSTALARVVGVSDLGAHSSGLVAAAAALWLAYPLSRILDRRASAGSSTLEFVGFGVARVLFWRA